MFFLDVGSQLVSASQNTVAITLPTSLASGTQALPTDDSELYSLVHNNEPKSHLQSPDAKKKSYFDLKRFNKALLTDALVAICSSLRDLGTQQGVSLRIPKRSCKIVEMLSCEMPMPVLFFMPPTSKKLRGHIGLGLSVCLSDRLSV